MKKFFQNLIPLGFIFLGQITLQAQEKQTLFDEFRDGGLWLLPIFLFGTGALALTIYNLIKVRKGPFL